VGRVFPGEGPRLQIFESVLDGLLSHHLTEGHTWVVYSGEHLPKSFLGVFEQWACADDVVACLKRGGQGVRGVFARTLEEGRRFVLVLPYASLEVLPCGSMVSAHLGEPGHKGARNGFKPLSGFSLDESGGVSVPTKGIESAVLLEDLLLGVLQEVQVIVPLLKGEGLDF